MEISKIIIGIDNSKYAEHAAAYGFDLARKIGAAVGLVNIIEPVPSTITPATDTTLGMPFEGTPNLVYNDIMDAQNEASSTIVKSTVDKYGQGLNVSYFNEYGSSSDGILSCAAQFGASLIVVGTHHRSGLDRLLMGSVAESIIRNADIPVLVVPLPEENKS
ncbi:universal stress protein [Mucilaginibacter robiniae]|uniref:Universal stress protein n=1 Tax=Mucilaginibacter robiniae TaxID=2728022 RepID=A0A7L5E214_9SPHI|nr:universal stress protein [Mucilaginibacter robiniae]QJD97390.1 universal stress protein [Mucilaginibacter robiniae]